MKRKHLLRAVTLILLLSVAVLLFAVPAFAESAENAGGVFAWFETGDEETVLLKKIVLYTSLIGVGLLMIILIAFFGGAGRDGIDELNEKRLARKKRKAARARAREYRR